MNDKLLTVVVPSYNVSATLRQTVESMLVPDESLRKKLDILIVNDGSTDDTRLLADALARDEAGVVRVWNKENGGHGSTINVGIEQAWGKYLKIVDGDDWLDTAALEKYLRILDQTDADVVATDFSRYYMGDDRMESVKASTLPYGGVFRFEDAGDQYTFAMHSLAVKTELLRRQPYRIHEHCYYVDVEFDTLVAMAADTVLYVDLKLYVYRLQNAGQSVSVEGWIKHYPEQERVALTLVRWYQELEADEERPRGKMAYLEREITDYAGWHYAIGLRFPPKERKVFLAHLKEYDRKLKAQGERVYRLAGKRPMVRILRLCGFPYAVYSVLSALRAVKHFLKV